MSERMQLTITHVDEVKAVGTQGAQKLGFKAKTPDGKEIPFFSFRKSLFDIIKGNIGKAIDADVEITSKEVEGNTYTDRKVNEIFVDGKPVAGESKGQGQGRPWQGKTPEQIEKERHSIESQQAIIAVTALLTAGKPVPEATVAKYFRWIDSRLVNGVTTNPPIAQVKATVITEEPPAKQKAATIPTTSQPKSITGADPPRDPASIKTIMEMFRACFDDFGLTSKQTLEALLVKTQQDIRDTPAICYELVRNKAKLQKGG